MLHTMARPTDTPGRCASTTDGSDATFISKDMRSAFGDVAWIIILRHTERVG